MAVSKGTMETKPEETSSSTTEQVSEEDSVTDIPSELHDVCLKCLSTDTLEVLKQSLDISSDFTAENGFYKDFTGLAEWAGLDIKFIRYIKNIGHQNKVSEVISMWLKEEAKDPKPTVANLLRCLIELDRPDIITDVKDKIGMYFTYIVNEGDFL